MKNLNAQNKITVDKAREDGEKYDWDDIRFLSDEELLLMYPTNDLAHVDDYEHPVYEEEDHERLFEIIAELNDILQEIQFSEKCLDNPDLHSNALTEIRADIVNLRRKAAILTAESEEIRRKYEGRSK